MCTSVGPRSRHRKLQISDINLDQGKNNVMVLKRICPTNFPVYVLFFCVESHTFTQGDHQVTDA